MYYSHVPRYQKILQLALDKALGSKIDDLGYKKITVEYLLNKLDLEISSTAFSRFRNSDLRKYSFEGEEIDTLGLHEIEGTIKKRHDALRLWNFIYENGDIGAIIKSNNNNIVRKSLHPLEEVAGVTIAYNDAHDGRIAKYQNAHLVDPENGSQRTWVSYKLSTRRPGFILKSKMTFRLNKAGFFEVTDEQISTGRFETSKKRFKDVWRGFGFSKTGNLWCHLTQAPFSGQVSGYAPRIICFNQADFMDENSPLTEMRGFSIEQDNYYENAAVYERRIALLSLAYDREIFEKTARNKGYLEAEQFDNFPYAKEVRQDHQLDIDCFVPSWIAKYLNER